MALGFLRKRNAVIVEANPKVVRLIPSGREAQDRCHDLLTLIEKRWQTRFGESGILNLREALAAVNSRLFEGLAPWPCGWRASIRKPNVLPHYPMVLHRGGFPDGS